MPFDAQITGVGIILTGFSHTYEFAGIVVDSGIVLDPSILIVERLHFSTSWIKTGDIGVLRAYHCKSWQKP
jgi:hypothetical protein